MLVGGFWILDATCGPADAEQRRDDGRPSGQMTFLAKGADLHHLTRVHWRLWGRARLGMFLRLKELRIMAYRCHAPLIFTYQDWLALSEPTLGVFLYISSSGNSGSI